MASSATQEKLKILCLHGYRQNSKTFREKSGAFRKLTKKYADLVYIDAPLTVPPLTVPPLETSDENPVTDTATEHISPGPDQRGWWFSRDDEDYFKASDGTDSAIGFDLSFKVVEEAIKTQGPFDGLLGFSQGAAMAALLCGIMQKQRTDCVFQFDFAILVAGFKSQQSPHDIHYSTAPPVCIPTLHVFGDTDQVIPKEMSKEMLQYFSAPMTLPHPGGHFIPASAAQKHVYHSFLEVMLSKKTAMEL